MFCTKCGKQIGDYDQRCSDCGQENKAIKSPLKQYKHPYESPVAADLAFVFAVFTPLIGIVWSIFAGLNYKSANYSSRCTVAIWVSIISTLVQLLFFGLLFTPIFTFISPYITEALNFVSDFVSGIFFDLFNFKVA